MMRHIGVALLLLAGTVCASACQCSDPFDPCTILPLASDVVVIEVIFNTGWLGVAAVRVVEVLKGDLRVGDVALTLGGNSTRVPPGTRLLQLRKRGDYFRVGCCGPTWGVSYYGHWLRGWKNNLRGGPPMVMGDVWGSSGGKDSGPLAGVRVWAQCGGRSGTATTDARGQYVIEGLAPGACDIRLQKPGYQDDGIWARRKFVLGDGCGWASSRMEAAPQ